MPMYHSSQIVKQALQANGEATSVEFKEAFDPRSAANWCEIVKDIVAIANSGGGVIVFGLDSQGIPNAGNLERVSTIDPAVIADKIHKYTRSKYADVAILCCQKNGAEVVCFAIGGVRTPMVFAEPGTYSVEGEKYPRTAFARGTVYFRHGAKSEPGTSEDLQRVIERELERIRHEWVDNLRRVVEAPSDAQVLVIPAGASAQSARTGSIRLTDDPAAPLARELDPNTTHPHRQMDVARNVQERLGAGVRVIPYDIHCVSRVYSVESKLAFCYRHRVAGKQYSDAYVEWIVAQYAANPDFFQEVRRKACKIPPSVHQHIESEERVRWLIRYMRDNKLTGNAMSKRLGYSAAALSCFLRGIYKGNIKNLHAAIDRFRAKGLPVPALPRHHQNEEG